jgi:8-oxo-dGTP diphosphatase
MSLDPTRPEVTVVAAVIEERDAFLVTRRPQGVHLAGMWEFPGGKISGSESHTDALRREIREELGADVEVGALILETTHVYDDRAVRLFFYCCRLLGTPRPLVGQQMRWVPRVELGSLGFPPADEVLIDRLLRGGSPGGP